ncbi:MAG: hypothetical protein GY857_18345 [Desulfobacula sp.]|nr:hypothetical protein [Desulfobacula sp.]
MGSLDAKDIVIGRKKFIIPFEQALTNDCNLLQCNELLRFIPGRRAVLSGLWQKKKIVAKFFFKPFRYKKHVKKEIMGNDLLKQAKIPTSKILYSGFCKELKSHILIFEFIDSSIKLGKIFELDPYMDTNSQKVTDSKKITSEKYLVPLVRLIARIHQKGIIHNDLHPDNFLLKNDMIYALDGASLKKISARPLEKNISLENLSIILSQINIQSKNLLYDLALAYAESRKYRNINQVNDTLEKFIKKSHGLRTVKYLKKIYRSSTKIICKKSFSSFMLCHRKYYTPDMESFLQNPDIAFNQPGTSLLKAGNTATLALYKIDGHKLVVKRYNMKNRFHALRLAFKKSRADISWRSAHLLLKNRINTPKPIAVKEIRFGPFRNKAFFICEYIKGESARSFFCGTKTDGFQITAESIIKVLRQFKSLKISHGDMKATNIIIKDNTPFFIDLDSMNWYKSEFLFSHAWKKDINRFMKNWNNNLQIAGLFKALQG